MPTGPNEAGGAFLDRPGRREAAFGHGAHVNTPGTRSVPWGMVGGHLARFADPRKLNSRRSGDTSGA